MNDGNVIHHTQLNVDSSSHGNYTYYDYLTIYHMLLTLIFLWVLRGDDNLSDILCQYFEWWDYITHHSQIYVDDHIHLSSLQSRGSDNFYKDFCIAR